MTWQLDSESTIPSCWCWWCWWWSWSWRFSGWLWGCLQRCNFIARRKNATKSIRTTLICHLTRYLDNFDICIQSWRSGQKRERGEMSTVANNNDNLRQGHQSSCNAAKPECSAGQKQCASVERRAQKRWRPNSNKSRNRQRNYIVGANAVNCRRAEHCILISKTWN